MALYLHEEIALGLTAGPVPPRVDATVKAGVLDLIDHAVDHGWSARAACEAIGLDHMRAARWSQRREADRLTDLPPGGHPVHGLLDWERAEILALHTEWGERDRSHRKLAHRGSLPGSGVGLRIHGAQGTGRRRVCAARQSAP